MTSFLFNIYVNNVRQTWAQYLCFDFMITLTFG